tara:strand:+ start:4381 stop:4887 length:507 start_codon:yes stop_codon:yes gene_type:complete
MLKKVLLCFLVVILTTPALAEKQTAEDDWKVRNGVRFGYAYLNKGGDLDKLHSSHMLLLGFEFQQTLDGGEWLDVLFVQNVSVVGLDQSIFAPSASLLVGFEFADRLQLALGANIAAFDPAEEDNYVHVIAAMGYTEQVGIFSIPVHVTYIPDVNGYWRMGVSSGVNW